MNSEKVKDCNAPQHRFFASKLDGTQAALVGLYGGKRMLRTVFAISMVA
jgi:hypothetical protein